VKTTNANETRSARIADGASIINGVFAKAKAMAIAA
jgi:hypothetical protein